ncbi:ArsR/SmtB family transcription factor [Streptomyces sp. NPDC001668]|uniref:ArsR/SmtB family transcription factor n=1 Tax=unclassified Streptomyces TaxID=2593676 RepID=UPI003679717C
MTSPAVSSRALPHPERGEIRLEGILHALSDPGRLRIARELAAADGELSCSHFDLPVTKSTTTHHFRVLRALDDLFPGLLDTLLDAAARQAVRVGSG